MAKQFIREIAKYKDLYRDNITGIAWIEDGTAGVRHSIHANIGSTGSVRGMKYLGFWNKKDRTVRAGGFIYNIDTLVYDKDNEYDMIVLNECKCMGCIERREKKQEEYI